MSCHTIQEDLRILETENKILLMGNPNGVKRFLYRTHRFTPSLQLHRDNRQLFRRRPCA